MDSIKSLRMPESMLAEMLPQAIAWAEKQQLHILEHGQDLNERWIGIARRAGVKNPERVRFLSVPTVPLPEEADLKDAAQALGLLTESTEGMTLGYGVFILQRLKTDPKIVLAHELVHVSQFELCGSFAAFLQKYLSEVNEHGYPEAPMEQEAIAFTEREFPG